MIEDIESFIRELPAGVLFIDKQRKVRYMNQYAIDVLFGRDYFGKDILVFHNESARKKIISIFSESEKAKLENLPFVKIVDFKGKSSVLLVRLIELFGKDGEFEGITAVFYDVSSFAFGTTPSEIGETSILKRIPVPQGNRILFVDVKDITFIKSFGNFSKVFDAKGKSYFTNLQLSILEERLSSLGFFRSHRSYLLNLKFVKEVIFKDKKSIVCLNTDVRQCVPVSRRNRNRLKELLSIC